MFDTNNKIDNNYITDLPIVDRFSFFEVDTDTINYQPVSGNLSAAVINDTIFIIIPSGLIGIFKKTERYKIFYSLNVENQVVFEAMIKK